METKKSEHDDLESKKSIFFQVGLIVSLGLSLAAFEWETPVKQIIVTPQWEPLIDEVVIKNTVFEDKKPIVIPATAPIINIVSNESLNNSDVEIDVAINPDDDAPVYAPPALVTLADENPIPDDIPFVSVQCMPEFPGGLAALQEFLAINIHFPETAVQSYIQGTVYVYFVVEKDGSISNIKTLRGIGGGCNEEAERVIGKLPPWKPGEQQGKKVRVSFTIPVIFKLQ